jgi:hypothetical protein
MLTSLQILQFCTFALVTCFHLYFAFEGLTFSYTSQAPSNGGTVGSVVSFSYAFTQGCHGESWLLVLCIAVNFSILFLFLNFYSQSYSKGNKPSQPVKPAPGKQVKRKQK